LTLDRDALEIEITVEGKKEPLQLTVGGDAGKDTYYATSKQLSKGKKKTDVFTVRQEDFKEARKSPRYFSSK
jgi:hypothetical protein